MDASEFWSIGDYRVVGDLWSSPGRDLAASLQVAGLDVVDLATGTGVTAIAAAQHGAASVVGIDVTAPLLTEAARRADAADVDVRWVEADVCAVPLPDTCADLVVSTFGLIFAADPGQAVTEARRLTRPGGRVVVTSWSPNGLFGSIRRAMARHFPETPAPWHESPDDIRAMIGTSADVREHDFGLRAGSAEELVAALERHSAPIVLAARALGERWPNARADLLAATEAAAEPNESGLLARVPYWVTTLVVDD